MADVKRAAQGGDEATPRLADQVFVLRGEDDQEEWRVMFAGQVEPAAFNARGAALAYLAQLTSGYRKPEAVPPRAAPPDSAVRSGDESPPRADLARAEAEAEVRAHDRVSPDAMLDPLAVVSLYVEAFVAGARFAVETRHDRDPKGA